MRAKDIASATDWREAARSRRAARAEELKLPSGATILAARPEPLEWILAGRLPQRLLAAALGDTEGTQASAHTGGEVGCQSLASSPESRNEAALTREDVLELARFAAQLVEASVVEPAIGDGPGEIRLEEIPIEDRAFIFEWACRALGASRASSAKEDPSSPPAGGLERFCAQ